MKSANRTKTTSFNPQPREVLPWKLGSISELQKKISAAAARIAPNPYGRYGRHTFQSHARD